MGGSKTVVARVGHGAFWSVAGALELEIPACSLSTHDILWEFRGCLWCCTKGLGLFCHGAEEVRFYMDATPWQISSLGFKLPEFCVIGDPREFVESHVCYYRKILEERRGFSWVFGTVYVSKSVESATPGVNICNFPCRGSLGRRDGGS